MHKNGFGRKASPPSEKLRVRAGVKVEYDVHGIQLTLRFLVLDMLN